MKCIYCDKEFPTDKGCYGHYRSCKLNPTYKPRQRKEGSRRGSHIPNPNFYLTTEYREKQRAIRLKQVADGSIMSKETREKISKAVRTRFSCNEERLKQSAAMKKAVLRNPASYTTKNIVGRVRNIEYRDGIILKGSWELCVAQAMDKLGIKWVQPTIGIKYHWNNGEHLYYPDFYLLERHIFVEVKGYERERDHAKWSAVPNIIVLKAIEIKQIRNGDFKCLLD